MVRIGWYSPGALRETPEYLHPSPTQPNESDVPSNTITSNNTNTEPITNTPSTERISGENNKGHGDTDLARTNPNTFLNCPDLRRLHKPTQAVERNLMHYLLIYELLLL